MKLVSAQLNFTVGDFNGNVAKMLSVIAQHGNQADLIVFSELSLSGYYPKDLIERPGFMEAQDAALGKILEASKNCEAGIVVGAVNAITGIVKKYENALLLIHNGQCVHKYEKQLLPTYGVFDEDRHFIAGGKQLPFIFKGNKIGFLICEDGWWKESGNIYKENPVDVIAQHNVDLVVSINASPYDIDKNNVRDGLVTDIAKKCNAPVIYVNQVGGIDELVFDGSSVAVNKEGEYLYIAPFFVEDVALIDTNADAIPESSIQRPDYLEIIKNQLVTGLRDYCHKTGFKKAVVGSSGGIDSAVTLALAVLALGSENVVGVTMPSKYSSAGSVDDSVDLCKALGIELVNAPIKITFDAEIEAYKQAFGGYPSPLAQENLQARIRGQRLMTYSNTTGALVLSTGNKSEMAVGYTTLYGDLAGGLSIIADLYKGQVYDLARYLNKCFGNEVIPVAIIEKEPSAELAPDQKDTDSLPPYYVLDSFLRITLEADRLPLPVLKKAKDIVENEMPKEMQEKVLRLIDRNEYKRRQAPPVLRVSKKAFGFDRQIPLTAKTYWSK